MALPLRSLAVFSLVIAGASMFAASSVNLTAGIVSAAAANTASVARTMKPSYVARMPVAKAEALNVAKAVPVKPKVAVPAATPVTATLEVKPAPVFSHRVAASGANVRSGPKKSFPQVFTLRQGSWVNIGENVRGWVKVTDETGREGWVFGSLLQAAERTTAAVN
jgi:uncharacterized protein YgiM (DUF1202 family)